MIIYAKRSVPNNSEPRMLGYAIANPTHIPKESSTKGTKSPATLLLPMFFRAFRDFRGQIAFVLLEAYS